MAKEIFTSFEDGIEGLRKFAKTQGIPRCSYATLTEKDGSFSFVPKRWRPCYGELRRYGTKSSRPVDIHPGDLPEPLHPGRPVAVAIPLTSFSTSEKTVRFLLNYPLNPLTSPWRGVLKDYELSLEGKYPALIIKDTKFDPTLLVSLLLNLRNLSDDKSEKKHLLEFFSETVDASPILPWVLFNTNAAAMGSGRMGSFSDYKLSIDGYSSFNGWSFKMMLAGEHNRLAEGDWYDEKCYNRPFLHHVFSPHVTKEDYPKAYDGSVRKGSDGIIESRQEVYTELRKSNTKSTTSINECLFQTLIKVFPDKPINFLSMNDITGAYKEIGDALSDWS